MEHTVTLTTKTRQLGRTRITDHYWTCSCGRATTAPLGLSTRHDAHVDSLGHRQWYRH